MGIPSKLPEWATDVGADIVEPSLGQKQDGWDVDDRPPPGWENWKSNLVYQWLSMMTELQVRNWFDTTVTTNRLGIGWGLGWWMLPGTNASGQMMLSRDGKTWDSETMPGTEDYWAADGDDTYVVAVGDNGTIAHATDPRGTWIANNHGTADFRRVRKGNGVWVASSANGDVYTATDPTGTWTARANPAVTAGAGIWGLIYVDDLTLWIGVGEKAGGFSGIMTAPDPTSTWTERTNPIAGSAFFYDVAYNGTTVVAVGGDDFSRGDCITSTNGTSYTDKSSSLPTTSGWARCVDCDQFGHIIIFQDVAVSQLGNIHLSVDEADNWEAVGGNSLGSAGEKGVHYATEVSQWAIFSLDDVSYGLKM